MTQSAEILFKLLRFAMGADGDMSLPDDVDWQAVVTLSFAQGVPAIAADGLQRFYDANPGVQLSLDTREMRKVKFAWSVAQMNGEEHFRLRERVAERIAGIWKPAGIGMVVLKGASYGRLYPVPEHRQSSDLDLLTLGDWKLSNDLLEQAGYAVDRSEKKHAHLRIKGLHVENHQFVCGTRGNAEAKRFDARMKGLLAEGKTDTFNLLFYLKHAQMHFLIEGGIHLKYLLDWVVLRRFLTPECAALVHEFHLDRFMEVVGDAAAYMMGECEEMTPLARVMMEDILKTGPGHGLAGSRFKAHVRMLRSMWRRRRFYRDFSEMSALRQIWTYIWGYLADR